MKRRLFSRRFPLWRASAREYLLLMRQAGVIPDTLPASKVPTPSKE